MSILLVFQAVCQLLSIYIFVYDSLQDSRKNVDNFQRRDSNKTVYQGRYAINSQGMYL